MVGHSTSYLSSCSTSARSAPSYTSEYFFKPFEVSDFFGLGFSEGFGGLPLLFGWLKGLGGYFFATGCFEGIFVEVAFGLLIELHDRTTVLLLFLLGGTLPR